LRIINEPTAASLAYGLDKRHAGLVAVYDFGGGTFDISILRIEDGVFQVLSTNGDTHLGGDDIDQLFTARVLEDLERGGAAVSHDGEFVQTVRTSVIRAKHELSNHEEAEIAVSRVATGGPDGQGRLNPQHQPYRMRLTRAAFEEAIAPIVERTLGRAAYRTEPRRSRRAWRGAASGYPRHWQPGVAAARRHAAVARHRDDGRRGLEDHLQELDDPRDGR